MSERPEQDSTAAGATPTLATLTTTGVGGPVGRYVRAETDTELVAAVSAADERGDSLLLVGGGSNILAADEGFPGTVVHVASRGANVVDRDGDRVRVRFAAGHPWDDAVAWSVEHGLAGLESLSGIPGTAGATPVQNVGAYGSEVSRTVLSVLVWDRHDARSRTFTASELDFSYRDSLLKRTTHGGSPRYVVRHVDFVLRASRESEPVRYAQLADALGVQVGERVALPRVRDAVLALRASKGMVLDAGDRDTFSTGSFFTNPVVTTAQAERCVPSDAPRFPALDAAGEPVAGYVKLSAAWLIDHAGFGKGFGLPGTRNERLDIHGESVADGCASLSTKHTLALTNRGTASAADVRALARTVRDGVEKVFGIRLVPEPVVVGSEPL